MQASREFGTNQESAAVRTGRMLVAALMLLFALSLFGSTRAFAADGVAELDLDAGSISILSMGYMQDGGSIVLHGGSYRIFQSGGGSTQNTITVVDGDHVLVLERLNIDVSGTLGVCAFAMQNTARAELSLVGPNSLKSGGRRAGLEVMKGAAIVLRDGGEGVLDAVGGEFAAGIGGGVFGVVKSDAGEITIEGGYIRATAGTAAAGIGGGYGLTLGNNGGDGGVVVIRGGIVEAGGDTLGACIGGGVAANLGQGGNGGSLTVYGGVVKAMKTTASGTAIGGGYGNGEGSKGGNGATVAIHGGIVLATSNDISACIGGAFGGGGGDGGDVLITGGEVIVTQKSPFGVGIGGCGDDGRGGAGAGGNVVVAGGTVKVQAGLYGFGIGGGTVDAPSGSFSTALNGAPGNAFIVASSISDQSGKADWSGVVFEGTKGMVYGNPVLSTDAEIPIGFDLNVPDGRSLDVAAQTTLGNRGAITIETNAALTVREGGALLNFGTIFQHGALSGEVVNEESGVVFEPATFGLSMQKKVGGQWVSAGTALSYGDTVRFVATARKIAAPLSLQSVARNQAVFWLGGLNTGTLLGVAEATEDESGLVTAVLEVGITETRWLPTPLARTIAVEFGESTTAGLVGGTSSIDVVVAKGVNPLAPMPATSAEMTFTDDGTRANVTLTGTQPGYWYGWTKDDLSPEAALVRWKEAEGTTVAFENLELNERYFFWTLALSTPAYNEAISQTSLEVATAEKPSITTTELSPIVAGTPIRMQFEASGTPPFTWSVWQGALPAGLVLDASTGVLSGTPKEAGLFLFTLAASNLAGEAHQEFALNVEKGTDGMLGSGSGPHQGSDADMWELNPSDSSYDGSKTLAFTGDGLVVPIAALVAATMMAFAALMLVRRERGKC